MKNIIINKLQNDSLGLVHTNHTPKGFRTINSKDEHYATLSLGLFDEIHEAKLIERYNNTLYNTKTGKITKFVASDTLYNKYHIDAAVFAWQVDPLAAKYPNMSPYCAFNSNPIIFIDPTGKGGKLLLMNKWNYRNNFYDGVISFTVKIYSDHPNVTEQNMNDIGARLSESFTSAMTKGTVNVNCFGYSKQVDVTFILNVEVITDYAKAVEDMQKNNTQSVNFMYVDDVVKNPNLKGEAGYADGNSLYVSSDMSGGGLLEELMHTTDMRPNNDIGGHTEILGDLVARKSDFNGIDVKRKGSKEQYFKFNNGMSLGDFDYAKSSIFGTGINPKAYNKNDINPSVNYLLTGKSSNPKIYPNDREYKRN